jgi:hypothetical protein
MDIALDGKWIKGINSLLDPSLLQEGEYPWSINTDNTGGIIQTRQGFNAIGVKDNPLPALEPKGCEIFKGKDGTTKFILALGSELWAMSFPIVQDFKKIGTGFFADGPVFFTKTLQSVQLQPDGTLQVLPNPIPYLIMTNGTEQAKYWDGFNLKTSLPSGVTPPAGDTIQPGIPVGKITVWSGNRLWISNGRTLQASDLGNPLAFFEATYVAGGGALFFDDEIVGMTQTADLQNLIVCSDFDTSAVQSNIYDRTTWGSTPGFQRVIFPGIGCAAAKSFVRQWGINWWMSHGGWIGMDQALLTYQRSRIQYRDQQMMRAKERLNGDKSVICAEKFGNSLCISVPYGNKFNAGTWVLNQRVLDLAAPVPYLDYSDPAAWSSQWTGILPVEYALAVIDGQERLFCLSRHKNLDGSAQPVVWEMFTGERQDRYNDTIYRIPCLFEGRLMGVDGTLRKFHYGEIDTSELLGITDVEALVAGRKGNYHSILKTQIVASPGSINSSITAQFVTETTDDVAGDATFLPVASVEGALTPPAVVFVNGLPYSYIGVQVGQGQSGGGQPPQTEQQAGETGFILAGPGGINPPPQPPPPGPPPEVLPVPSFDPAGGTYDVVALYVQIGVAVNGAKLAWTVDGTIPSRTHGHQTLQNAVIVRIDGGTFTLQAMAYLPDDQNSDSPVGSQIYVVAGGRPQDIMNPFGPDVVVPDGPDPTNPNQFPIPDIVVPTRPAIPKGTQVIQIQFNYAPPPLVSQPAATILTSYVSQRRMLRTEEWDIRKYSCTSCGVEDFHQDNIDRGFSFLIKWTGRMAINGIRMMTEKYPDPQRGRCTEDELLSRALDQSGCGNKSLIILESPTFDTAPLHSQYLRSVTHRAFDEPDYSPVPVEVAQPPPGGSPQPTVTPPSST